MEELLVVPDDASPELEVPPELLSVELVPVELPVVAPELPEVSEPVEPVVPVEPVEPVELSLPEGLGVEDEEPDVPPPASSVLRLHALSVSTADKATARTAADFRVDAYMSVPFSKWKAAECQPVLNLAAYPACLMRQPRKEM